MKNYCLYFKGRYITLYSTPSTYRSRWKSSCALNRHARPIYIGVHRGVHLFLQYPKYYTENLKENYRKFYNTQISRIN